MKKLLISTLFALVMIFGVMSNTSTARAASASAQTSAAKAKSKYSSFVKKNRINSYKVVDIDKNGIPELLYFDSKTLKQVVSSYNAKTGKMVTLCSSKTGKICDIYYKVSAHKVVLRFNSTGDNNFYVYQVKGLKAVRTGTYIATRGSNRVWKRTINGKRVSDNVYWNKTDVFGRWSRVQYRYW